MKTFTTYAEKKAKQFLNLLQGYTRGIRLTAILILLLMGVSNVWAEDVAKNAVIYMDNSAANWTYSNIYFVINSNGYPMSEVTNTKLYVHKRTDNTWGGYESVRFFAATSSWGGNNASLGNENNMSSYGANLTNTITKYGFSAEYYVIKLDKAGTKTSSSTRANLSASWIGKAYTDLNKTITIQAKVSTNGGSSYSDANAPAELTGSSKIFTAYNSCAGTDGASATLNAGSSSTTFKAGYTANTTLTAVAATGYTFEGWYSGATKISDNDNLSTTVNPTGDVTYYAYYKANQYTVKFDANGGTGTMSNQSYAYGVSKALTANAFTRTGYTFEGWNTKADGKGTKYTDKQSVSNLSSTDGATVTLYAQWTANKYTVIFHANDGTNKTANQDFTYDVEQKLSPIEFERADYKFANWNTKTDGTGDVYSDQASVKNLTNEQNGVFNLHAQWAPAQDTHEIPIKANAGGRVSPTSVMVNQDISATITATPDKGYKFVGWETEGRAQVADTDRFSTINATSTTVTATAAGSVTALFEALLPNTLTLTHQPMYKDRENPLEGVPGCDGTEANPYKIYSEEFVRITAAALPEVDGLTAYYKFGDKEQVENVFDFSEISGTTPSKITVKAYYKKDATVWGSELTTDSYYFLRIPQPYYVSTVPSGEMSLNSIADGENITVQFRSDDKTTVNLYVQTGDDSSTKTHLRRISNTASYDYTYDVPNNLEPCVLRFIAESEGLHNGRSFSKYAEVALYKNVTIKVNDPNNVLRKVYMWRGEDVKTQWPGEDFIKTFGTWRIFTVKYPYYDHFILNDGTQENQTFDYIIPADDKCYQLSENKVEVGGYTNYQITETTCPSDLLVGNIDAVTVGVGEQKVVIPAVEVGLGYQISDLETAVSSNNTSKATAVVSGKNIIVTGKATGSATITVTYTLDGTTVTKTFNVTVAAATSVTIQVKVPIADGGDYDNIGWADNSKLYLHYWFSDNTNANIPLTYIGEETGKYKHLQAEVPLHTDGRTNFLVYYEYLNDDVWRKSPDVKNVTTDGCYAMKNEGFGKQPSISRSGDYCWAEYQVKTLMQSGKEFTSNIVADADGIMSFFAPGKDETGRKAGAVMLYCNGSVVAAIDPATFETSTVYTATINDEGNGLENVAPYTGNYYIRTWGKSNDIENKGWHSIHDWNDSQKNSRKMTFFISREGEFYNHYWVQAVDPYNGGKDVSACVANDYNDDLAGKLTGDKNTDEYGNITFDNTMNLRFGYDPRTNYFGRAILRGSGENQDYLNLHCNNAYSDAACTTKLPYGTSETANKFRDISNWLYEREVYIKIDNNNLSASMYIEAKSPHNGKNVKNHLLGYVINEVTGEESSTPIQKTVIASGTDNGVYKVRVVYDFKTNRMISVWQPDGNIEVSTSKTLHADILFIRKENNQVPQITLTGDGQIKSVESVFFALELTRGDADKGQRHEEQYMFTLPFDCVVGSISGVPGYMEIWGIQRYRGDLRAQKGWYAETATFWEWMSLTDTLKAGEGYLLAFDKKNAHWEEFLEEDLVTKTSLLRLYFPSVQKGFDLKQKSGQQLTVTYPNHPCTLELHNRYLQDSNWKMIGTTSYNNATIEGYAKDDNPSYDELHDAPSFRYRYSYTFDNNNNRTSYEYEPENGKTATYQSFYGYMVQFAGTITWNPINETVPEPLAAPRRAQAARSSVTMRLELANIDLEKQDQTFVALDEKGTTTFDQNLDLNKVFNSGKANIYTLSEDIPFAGNTLPMEEAVVPVGVDIATAGEYTFRMPDGTEGMVVELIDYELETTTNLLLFDYTVTLPKGTNEGRFALHIQPSKSGVTTNIDQINGGSMHHEGVQKYLIDGKLIIRTAEGEVFDAQGHRL